MAITRAQRAAGWNISLLCGSDRQRFAGLFHHPGGTTLTYRDIANEIALCFQEPAATQGSGPGNGWHDIVFLPAGTVSRFLQPTSEEDTSASTRALICGQHLDDPVASLPLGPDEDAIRLHVVRHVGCTLNGAKPLGVHLDEGCAQHIRRPPVRQDPLYLPPNKASKDPRFTQFPYRKSKGAPRSLRTPSKNLASDVASPASDLQETADVDVADLVTPPSINIDIEGAKQIMAGFRPSCIIEGSVCAVTHNGRAWYQGSGPGPGPGVQACHVVSQQHYHTYPVGDDLAGKSMDSPERLEAAWHKTWSAANGLLLSSHLHEPFNDRLFPIHPDTLRVRAFVPYDLILELEHHGLEAHLPPNIDRAALRHHYEMCCIENMMAVSAGPKDPSPSLPATPVSRMGPASSLGSGSRTPTARPREIIPESGHSDTAVMGTSRKPPDQ